MKNLLLYKILFILLILSIELKSQWNIDYIPFNEYPYFINVIDTSTIWCLGNVGVPPSYQGTIVIKNPNYGGWMGGLEPDLPLGVQYTAIEAIDSDTAFVGDFNGNVYKTTNNGFNWEFILNAGSNYLVSNIRFPKNDKRTGYILCCRNDYNQAPAKIFKTTNYGNSWELINLDIGNTMFANKPSVWITDSNHVWIALWCISQNCPVSKIVYTSNGGTSWLYSDIETNRRGVQAVAFSYDNLNGLAFTYKNGTPNNLFKTTNGGLNWNYIDTVQSGNILSLITLPESSVWYINLSAYLPNNTFKPIFLKSSNNGLFWNQIQTIDSNEFFNDIDAVKLNNQIFLWATGYNKIYRFKDTSNVIGIENNSAETPIDFELYQNYPNPFNPSTKIQFQLNKNSQVILEIIDILGQQVQYFNKNLNSGLHLIDFNGETLSSGIYLYSIEVNGYKETRKMLLIK